MEHSSLVSPVRAVELEVPQMLAGLEESCSPSLKTTDILYGTTVGTILLRSSSISVYIFDNLDTDIPPL